jgi:hypothetical protein
MMQNFIDFLKQPHLSIIIDQVLELPPPVSCLLGPHRHERKFSVLKDTAYAYVYSHWILK